MTGSMPRADETPLDVVIVDDSAGSASFLAGLVTSNIRDCSALAFTDARQGLEWCLGNDVGLIVVDYMMPDIDGLNFLEAFRADSARAGVPIVMVTGSETKDTRYMALQLGATDFLNKPIDPVEFVTRVGNLLALSRLNRALNARATALAVDVERAAGDLVDALTRTVAVLSRALEMRDPYTNGHQKRVSLLAVAIAEALGLPPDTVTGIRLGSLVHDVGKIAVPAELLSCPRRLTPEEMALIRSHSAVGRDIIAEATFPWPLKRMVAEHHERLDGSGYPDGLRGEEICLEARIIAVADVIEAMSSHRPYRPALGIEVAIEEIRRHRGVYYDPQAVDACLGVLDGVGFEFWRLADRSAR